MEMLNVNINGNKKLKNNETTRFIIWNLPSVTTCPYRTALCEKSCYAKKAEKVYPTVLPSRAANLEESKKADFVENMVFTIERYLNSKSFKDKKTVFRIHESGDFYSLEYMKKWVHIARHFKDDNRIVFLAYTKSLEFVINAGYGSESCSEWFPKNFVVRSSLWNDTKPHNIDLTMLYRFPIYTALSHEDMENARKKGAIFKECRCDDCATCGKCWSTAPEDKNIIVKIH